MFLGHSVVNNISMCTILGKSYRRKWKKVLLENLQLVESLIYKSSIFFLWTRTFKWKFSHIIIAIRVKRWSEEAGKGGERGSAILSLHLKPFISVKLGSVALAIFREVVLIMSWSSKIWRKTVSRNGYYKHKSDTIKILGRACDAPNPLIMILRIHLYK